MKTALLIIALSFCVIGCDRPEQTVASSDTKTLYGKRIVATYEAMAIWADGGDRVKLLLDDKTKPYCRLESIDCPETASKNFRAQPFSFHAQAYANTLCVGKTVTVHKTGTDSSGRPLVFLIADGTNVNAALIAEGWAWHYNDDPELAAIEAEAKKAKRGLWAREDAVEPWMWQKQQGARKVKQ